LRINSYGINVTVPAYKGIQPVIFTDAATKMRDRGFVRRVYDSGATVVPKCDSLWNPEYQNWVVGDKTGKYFDQRNKALDLLMEERFNEIQEDGSTRLGFDMVVSAKNVHEVERTLRYCRENNLWIIYAFHLPTGRSGKDDFDKELVVDSLQRKEAKETVQRIDQEYGFNHPIYNNFLTAPCVEFMCIYGDGRVSPCVGNETIIGNIRNDKIKDLKQAIFEKFPCHNLSKFDGYCLYRPRIK